MRLVTKKTPTVLATNIEMVPLADLKPAAVNDEIYNRISPRDPAIRELAASIRRFGLKEPIVATLDDVIVSGHRRRVACKVAGLKTVPVRRESVLSTDPEFVALLSTFNHHQREKSENEKVREALVLIDPDEAYRAVKSQRAEAAKVTVTPLKLGERKNRAKISRGRRPFLDAVVRVVDTLRDYWPVSDRRIHYALLNDPPLIHASKPGSRYRNDPNCYKNLTNLLTQARLEGHIPFEAIGDDTRPVSNWTVDPSPGPFIRREVGGLFDGYARDLMQGQPNHIEIVGEKLTVEGIIRPVAMDFCIPVTIGRGYSSLPPRKAMYDRFMNSGKDKLVLLFLSDFDPEGEDIPTSYAKSMRDDLGIPGGRLHLVKVGLTHDQVRQLGLPPNTAAKAKSSRYPEFVRKYGPAVYELEAVPPQQLQAWLRDRIHAVIDVNEFNRQVEKEKTESARLAAVKKVAIERLGSLAAGKWE